MWYEYIIVIILGLISLFVILDNIKIQHFYAFVINTKTVYDNAIDGFEHND